jgi:hypothetical protein
MDTARSIEISGGRHCTHEASACTETLPVRWFGLGSELSSTAATVVSRRRLDDITDRIRDSKSFLYYLLRHFF